MNRKLYSGVSRMNQLIISSVLSQFNNMIQTTDSQNFALTGNVKAEDSLRKYYENDKWGIETANSLMSDPIISKRFKN